MQNFKRIFELIRRTGDRLVVTDPEGEETFVVMDIDDYEMLLDLGTSECQCDCVPGFEEDDDFDPAAIDEEFLFEPEQTFEPEPLVTEPVVAEEESPEKQIEQVLPKIETNFSEKSVKKEQDGEEEQFYLEPVE
jgi:hypothetical protein